MAGLGPLGFNSSPVNASSESDGDDFNDRTNFSCSGRGSSVDSSGSASPPIFEPPTALMWVRMSSLRLHDNQAFNAAMQDPSLRFRAVFVMDTWFETRKSLGFNRLRFMLESLHDLNKQLESYGQRLHVVQGHTLLSLEKMCEKWNVKKLFYLLDRDVHTYVVEDAVDNLMRSLNIDISKFESHTLYNAKDVFSKLDSPLTCMKQFRSLLPTLGSPMAPCVKPPFPEQLPLREGDTPTHGESQEDLDCYRIPNLQDFGYPESEQLYGNKLWIGGESEALKKLSVYIKKRKDPKPLTVEDLFDNSALSPYIRFGCMSVRYFFWAMREVAAIDPNYENLSRDVTTKLLQREFYFLMSLEVPHFDQCDKNGICLQLPWDEDDMLVACWKEGKTGYPWVDAAMRQLAQEGWIHYLLRECVATFLTRGDLWISWEHGKDAFEHLLLDFEPSVSCGCWMKSSCSGFLTGPVEHYCPITFGMKIDPHGSYIRKYIPELRNYPDEFIFSPWTAPLSVQIQAGCQVGQDYPSPIVDHRTAGVVCCEKLRLVMAMLQQANGSTTTNSTYAPECPSSQPSCELSSKLLINSAQ